MYALHFISSVNGELVQEHLLAVSTSLDNLMAHAQTDATEMEHGELVFTKFGNSHVAYVGAKVDTLSRYFIDHVLVV